MPRVATLLLTALGLAVFTAANATAQNHPTQSAPADWGSRPISSRQIPWTGGGARAVEPPRLLPRPEQPVGTANNNEPHAVRMVADQQPVPLPLTPKPNGRPMAFADRQLPPWATGAASLGIVLGLFLLVIWSVRRGTPGSSGIVPQEAVEVLGRAPIAGRQNVHLVRCGNKVLLVSVSATNVETLTEIVDPEEVDRLQMLCRHSTAPVASWKALIGRLGHLTHGDGTREQHSEQLDFGHLDAGSHTRA